MNLLLTEKLARVNQASSDEEQVQLLNYIKTPAVAGLLKINFNPEINFNLPEGNPPYKPYDRPRGIDHSYLEVEYRNFGYFFGESGLTPMKRESLFIDILERLHADEADLLMAIKNHNLTRLYPNIKKRNVLSAFWGLDVEEEGIKEEESPEYKVEIEETNVVVDESGDSNPEEVLEDSILEEFIAWQETAKKIFVAESVAMKHINKDSKTFKQKLAEGSYGFIKYPEGIRVYDVINYLVQRNK